MSFFRTTKFDKCVAALADKHYSRRTVGSPQFMPPGQTIVLVTPDGQAGWGWWRPHPTSGIVALNKLDGWTCTFFRNESEALSSTLILEAECELLNSGLGCGPDGMLTYVWDSKVSSANKGFCYKKAGWVVHPTKPKSADKKKDSSVEAFPSRWAGSGNRAQRAERTT